MPLNIALFVAGLAMLYYGAEWLVKGAGRLARSLGISALVVGLTVVAFGTSAPELLVTGVAAWRNQTDVAIGNIVGSNIANIALILAVAAMITPMRVEMRLITREMPFMIAATLAVPLLAMDGTVGLFDSLLLLAGFVLYIAFVLRAAPAEQPRFSEEYREFEARRGIDDGASSRLRNLALILAGLAVLVVGAHLLVESAVFFARAAGVSELVIALTVVAIGTSLPELATSVVAAFRREADIAAGNIVGSNIFNLLAILGVASLVRPLPVHPAMFRFELPVMIGLTLLMPIVARTGLRVGRLEGLLLFSTYVAFTVLLILRATGRVTLGL